MKAKRLKEIACEIKLLGYWIKSGIALSNLKGHLEMERMLNNLDESKEWSRQKISDYCEFKFGDLVHQMLGIKLFCFAGRDFCKQNI